MSLPSGAIKRPKEAAVHVATAHARTEARKAVARTVDARPPWSVDNARIIPAVTAAVTNTMFVMRGTIGQMPLVSRMLELGVERGHSLSSSAPDAGDERGRSLSTLTSDSATPPGETALEGIGDTIFES
eukprot:533349-Pleurochrysis_carterae.AAC.2